MPAAGNAGKAVMNLRVASFKLLTCRGSGFDDLSSSVSIADRFLQKNDISSGITREPTRCINDMNQCEA